jgi:very-short-patch-repair endonuclease
MKKRIFTKKSEQTKRRLLRNNSTKAEVLLWLEIKNKKLGVRFLRQYSVGTYVVDFYSPEIKLAVEVDGVTHISPEEKEYDRFRQEEIGKNGITFIRFSNNDVYENISNVVEKLKEKILELKKC